MKLRAASFKFCLPIILVLLKQSASQDSTATCKHNEFRCDDGSACLKAEKLCNGVEDCPKGEDEKGSDQWDCSKLTLGVTQCDQSKELRCRFGGCVDRKKACDGVADCWGGNDEAHDLCGPGAKITARPVKKQTTTTAEPEEESEEVQPPPKSSGPRTTTTTRRPRPKQTTMTTTPEPTRRTKPTTRKTTTTTEAEEETEEEEEVPEPEVKSGCPPIVPESGVDMVCKTKSKNYKCDKEYMPVGAVAEYRCSPYYVLPRASLPLLTRTCRDKGWSVRRPNWHCTLDCGNKSPDFAGFVVGGVQSRPGKYPWHVGFYNQDPPDSGKYEFFCGGTLVLENAVITAAHCVTRKQTSDKRTDTIYVMLGKYNRTFSNGDDYVQKRLVKDIEVHEDYNAQNFDSDIAIVWLEKNVKITEKVRPVCLPKTDEDVQADPDNPGTLVGWGRSDGRKFKEALQEAQLPVISKKECAKSSPALAALIRRSSFCAGHRNGTSACDGDSGGGLIFEDENKWFLQGVVSAGVNSVQGGCNPNHYTIFTRISSFLDWIQKKLYDRESEWRKRRSVFY